MAKTPWVRIIAGLIVVFVLFHYLARFLGSDRGQAGLVVGLTVVTAVTAVQFLLFRQAPRAAVRWLGLGTPASRGIVAVVAICPLLIVVVPLFAITRGLPIELYPGWLWLVPGLFAQAGLAEETLFRGYLFRHVREGRSFGRAVWLSLIPFAVVHLTMFATMPWPVALAAVMLAIVVTPPLAHLYELGGNTIWAPAILHFVMQGTVKVIQWPSEQGVVFPVVWMVTCGILPYLAFFARREE